VRGCRKSPYKVYLPERRFHAAGSASAFNPSRAAPIRPGSTLHWLGTTSGRSNLRRMRWRTALSSSASNGSTLESPPPTGTMVAPVMLMVSARGRGDEIDKDVDRSRRFFLALQPVVDDLPAREVEIMEGLVQAFDAAGAADRVDAAFLAAAAGIGGNLYRRVAGPERDDRAVAPFAGKAAGLVDQPSVDDHAAADAGAEDRAENDAMAATRRRGPLPPWRSNPHHWRPARGRQAQPRYLRPRFRPWMQGMLAQVSAACPDRPRRRSKRQDAPAVRRPWR
jgi:hypothetical protein